MPMSQTHSSFRRFDPTTLRFRLEARTEFTAREIPHDLASAARIHAAERACTQSLLRGIDGVAARQAREMIRLHGTLQLADRLNLLAEQSRLDSSELCPDPDILQALVRFGVTKYPVYIERATESVLRRGIRYRIGLSADPAEDSWFSTSAAFRFEVNVTGPDDPGELACRAVEALLRLEAVSTRWNLVAGLRALPPTWLARLRRLVTPQASFSSADQSDRVGGSVL